MVGKAVPSPAPGIQIGSKMVHQGLRKKERTKGRKTKERREEEKFELDSLQEKQPMRRKKEGGSLVLRVEEIPKVFHHPKIILIHIDSALFLHDGGKFPIDLEFNGCLGGEDKIEVPEHHPENGKENRRGQDEDEG